MGFEARRESPLGPRRQCLRLRRGCPAAPSGSAPTPSLGLEPQRKGLRNTANRDSAPSSPLTMGTAEARDLHIEPGWELRAPTPSSVLLLLRPHSPTQIPVDPLEEEEPGKPQAAGEGRAGEGRGHIRVGVSGSARPSPATPSIRAHWVAFSGRLAQAQPSGVGGVGGYLSPHFTVV